MLLDVEPGNQSTFLRQEKARVGARAEEEEEQHEEVQDVKLDSWRYLSCLREQRMEGTRWSRRLSPTRTCHRRQ